jgi:hypothetical protein
MLANGRWDLIHFSFVDFSLCDKYRRKNRLTLNLLTTTIVAPPSNASKWQMGFNSAFKGLINLSYLLGHTMRILTLHSWFLQISSSCQHSVYILHARPFMSIAIAFNTPLCSSYIIGCCPFFFFFGTYKTNLITILWNHTLTEQNVLQSKANIFTPLRHERIKRRYVL